jgi:DICT domain-containing protein
LTHEWFVICDSPSFSACLAGVELARDGRTASRTPDRARRFEALWTVDASVVRKVARAAGALAVTRTPSLADALDSHWRKPIASATQSLRATTPLTNRIVRHLDIAKWRS